MKTTFLIAGALWITGVAIAQEPVNRAVQQPSVTQPGVSQPTVQQPADPRMPAVYEPFVFQPMANIPHQAQQRTVSQRGVQSPSSPVLNPVTQVTTPDAPTTCGCKSGR